MTKPSSTSSLGQQAEARVAGYLEDRDYRVLVRNYRTRWYEIDIVAERDGVIHVVEVKYRRRAGWGDGFEAITPDKTRRLIRAAQQLMADKAPGRPFQIDVASVIGELPYADIEYIENAIQQ